MAQNAQSAEAAQHERPREQEHGERVEDDEDERHEVEPHRELDPRLADGLGAALVVLELAPVGTGGAEHRGHPEGDHRERDDQAQKHDDGEIPGHTCLLLIDLKPRGV